MGRFPAISKKARNNVAAVAAVFVAFGLIAAKNLRADGSNHWLSASNDATEALHQSLLPKLDRSPIIPIDKDGDEANAKFFAGAAIRDSFWKVKTN